jgi:hypothetical protein
MKKLTVQCKFKYCIIIPDIIPTAYGFILRVQTSCYAAHDISCILTDLINLPYFVNSSETYVPVVHAPFHSDSHIIHLTLTNEPSTFLSLSMARNMRRGIAAE